MLVLIGVQLPIKKKNKYTNLYIKIPTKVKKNIIKSFTLINVLRGFFRQYKIYTVKVQQVVYKN